MNKQELNNKLAELYDLEPKLGKTYLIDDSARMFDLSGQYSVDINYINDYGFVVADIKINDEKFVKAFSEYKDHKTPSDAAKHAIALALIELAESK